MQITKAIITSSLLAIPIFAMDINQNDLIIKKNLVYLLKQQQDLNKKVKTLGEKLNSSNEKISFLMSEVNSSKSEIMKLKNQVKELKAKELNQTSAYKVKEDVKKDNASDTLNSILPFMYRVVYSSAPAYSDENLTGIPKHIYKHLDIVKVVNKKNKEIWQLDNGLWIKKRYLTQMIKSKEKFNYSFKVSFYRIGTYQANIREKPDINSSIVRVFDKNNIVKIVKWVTVKEDVGNGKFKDAVWGELDNGLFVKKKLLIPMY